MKPELRRRLEAAADFVAEQRRAEVPPATIIERLVADHSATHKRLMWTNTLRIAGVATSCTSSPDDGLLKNWMRLATLRLMEPEGGYGRE